MSSQFNKDIELQPLAARMRPHKLAHFFGQQHLLAADKPLRQAIEQGKLHPMILWGPAGTGKTTLARLMAEYADARFESLSAVLAGVKDVRAAVTRAQNAKINNQATILFIDEVHRFNKAQQDAFLPFVEDGTLTLMGATTENPSFALNNALLSRTRVYVLKSLTATEILQVIQHALTDTEIGLGSLKVEFPEILQKRVAEAADGDARTALNLIEIIVEVAGAESENKNEIGAETGIKIVTEMIVNEVIGGGVRRFDRGGDAFYDAISALHKSVRGSAPDAALYWLARMLDGGCDPLYIARRIVRMASEDIGNADPRALTIALNAWDVQERLGSPEGELALAQAVLYLACAAKSNAVYKAFNQVYEDVKKYGSLPIPIHLRNAPTRLMRELGYGKAYRYAHDETNAYAAGENYFPEAMPEKNYYHPVLRGLEIKIAEKLQRLKELDKEELDKKSKK